MKWYRSLSFIVFTSCFSFSSFPLFGAEQLLDLNSYYPTTTQSGCFKNEHCSVNFVHNTLWSIFSICKCFRYLSLSSYIYSCPSSFVYFNICLNSYKSLIIIIYSKSVLKFHEPLCPFFSFFGKLKKAKLVLLYITISYNKFLCLLSP